MYFTQASNPLLYIPHYILVKMDTDDMPDFMAAPAGGTADEMLDEADELENLLEDALEENEEEEEEEQAVPMATETTTTPAPVKAAPAAQPTPIATLGK